MNRGFKAKTIEDLETEREMLLREVYVSRDASRITSELVVEQFEKMEEIHRELQSRAAVERRLRERLSEELREAEARERELARAREAAEAASRSKSTFLANMSHDLMMPEMDGFEFLDRLRSGRGHKNVPVVVVTAKDLTTDDHKRLHRQAERVIQKGAYSRNDLLREVSRLVKAHVREDEGL